MSQDFAHDPVMVEEVVALLAPVPPGVLIDGTLGGGGHAAAALAAHPQLDLLGLDRDPAALAAATDRLAPFGDRVTLRHARFSEMTAVAAEVLGERAPVAAVLLDLGVSSPQLDRAERGFSYRLDGPLDMRMDPGEGLGALELVNEASVDELARLFAANGEGRLARRIARAVTAARPITTTVALADVVSAAVPAAARRRGHPARRVFQALRIAVNDEIGELASALPAVVELPVVGGRSIVIAYHSGEDRLVKAAFAEAATGGCTCPPGLPCGCGARPVHHLVFRGAKKATPKEVLRDRRADAARLRALERTGGGVVSPAATATATAAARRPAAPAGPAPRRPRLRWSPGPGAPPAAVDARPR